MPQYVGVNLLVEGTPIRRPRAAVYKHLTQSQPEPLSKSSNHYRTSLTASHCSAGKENQSEVPKRAWPTLPTHKATLQHSLTLRPKLRKRPHRLVLPSSCYVFPNPAELLPQKLSHNNMQLDHSLTNRTHSNLPSLFCPNPSLDIISLRPEENTPSRHKHDKHPVSTSYPVLRMQQYLSRNQRRGRETFKEKEGPKSS